MSPTFSAPVLKYSPWSLTKADHAGQCAMRFFYQYVEKRKEQAVARGEGRIGKAAHQAIELVLKGENLNRSFTVAAVDNKLTTNEIDDLLTFKGTVKDFLTRIEKFKAQRGAEKQYIEHKFGFTADLKPTSFFAKNVFFRGVWDLAFSLASKDLIIVDHKSGTPADTIDRYTNQLNSYAVAGRILLPEARGVQSAIHYLKTGEVKWHAYISTNDIDAKLIDWFVDYLNTSVKNLESGCVARPGWYCNYCGYSNTCAAHLATK